MIRFHGGPVTPLSAAAELWTGRHALVSFASPAQLPLAAEISQSFCIDNGAFSLWGDGQKVDVVAYADFVRPWGNHPGLYGAFIPDDIDGDADANDRMIARWHGQRVDRGIPVWHLHEPLERLEYLVRCSRAHVYPAVALGSSGQWATPGNDAWWFRIAQAMEVACDEEGRPRCKLHGLRMMDPAIFARIPLASVDSCNVGRNIGVDKKWTGPYPPVTKAQRAAVLATRIEHAPTADRWIRPTAQQPLQLYG